MPVYVGAQAKVTRTPEGVKIWLKDYKGETEEIVAEAIADIITNPDGSLLFVLPDGRTILTDSLKGDPGCGKPFSVSALAIIDKGTSNILTL